MPRTKVAIDAALLVRLKREAEIRGITPEDLIANLLAVALARDARLEKSAGPFEWRAERMRARVALDDKEALRRALADG